MRHRLDVEPRRWEPGEHTFYATLPLPPDLPPGDYRLALWLLDLTVPDDPRYTIRLANEDIWDAERLKLAGKRARRKVGR